MFGNFSCERLEERSADGRLAAVGVRWTENRNWLDGIVMALMAWSAMASVAPLVVAALMQVRGGSDWWIPAMMSAAMISPILWMHRIRFPGKPRELWFRRDGTMPAPLGFHAYSGRYHAVSGNHADVVSIEARSAQGSEPGRYPHSVVFYKRKGAITHVAMKLSADEAHEVTVQLTHALRELREDMTSGHRRPGTQGQTAPAAKVLID